MRTYGLCPRFLDTTYVDTTHRLGFRGTNFLHVIHKYISSLLVIGLAHERFVYVSAGLGLAHASLAAAPVY